MSVYMDPYTIENKHRQTVVSRSVFETMLSLVPEESIQDAVAYYEEKWWEWVTRYYKARAVLVSQEKVIADKLDALAELASKSVEQLTKEADQRKTQARQKKPMLVKKPVFEPLSIGRDLPDLSHQSILMQARQWEADMDKLEQERAELYQQITALWVGAGMIPTRCNDAILDEFGPEICDAWVGFEIEDVIWIQHNAISHMYYYKIINEARRYHIPVRYFSYASAVKCAEQIVNSEDSL